MPTPWAWPGWRWVGAGGRVRWLRTPPPLVVEKAAQRPLTPRIMPRTAEARSIVVTFQQRLSGPSTWGQGERQGKSRAKSVVLKVSVNFL